MKYKKYKTEEEKKKKKKLLAILLPLLFVGLAAIITPITIVFTRKTQKDDPYTPTPSPTPTPTPTPTPYTGPTFKFDGTILLGFADKVTQKIILQRFPNGSITIPECSEIADGAFDGKFPSDIKELILPSDTTTIGNSAFANNPNISKITFYEGKDISHWKVGSLGDKAFYNTSIETFTTPFDLSYIGSQCFDKCSKLSYLDLRISDSESGIKFDTESFANIAESGKVIVRTKTKDYWQNTLAQAGLVNKEKSETEFSDKWEIIEYSCIDVDDQNICYGYKRDIPYYLEFLIDLEADPLIIPDNVVKISNQYGGFSNHEQIKQVVIPSTVQTIEEGCFLGCSNINYIDISSFVEVPSWAGQEIFKGCAEKGKFEIIQDNKSDWRKLLKSISGLIIDKDHWKVGDDSIEIEYCTGIYANEDTTISFGWSSKLNIDMNYSYDGKNWQKYENNTQIELLTGQTIYFQGLNPSGLSNGQQNAKFNASEGDIELKGSVMGLLNGGWDELDTIPNDYCFYRLFHECDAITKVEPNFLPATNLTKYCYSQMFYRCDKITTPPELPATTAPEQCYEEMFSECPKLAYAPELPATTLGKRCYYQMFLRCYKITYAPYLPATELVEECYNSMFQQCTSLTTVEPLPATVLKEQCYLRMFDDCTSLEEIEIMAQTLANKSMMHMLSGCTNLKKITIHFDEWEEQSTYQWLLYASSSGSIYGPTQLNFPTSPSTSFVPSGWTYQQLLL